MHTHTHIDPYEYGVHTHTYTHMYEYGVHTHTYTHTYTHMCVCTQGACAGAGAGVCQVSVMGPCTFLVTAVVTQGKGTHSHTVSQLALKVLILMCVVIGSNKWIN